MQIRQPACEVLESRVLFASATAVSPASILGLFGGSIVFPNGGATTGSLAGSNHVVVHVDNESDNGAISGNVRIDGFGRYDFVGSARSDAVFLVFSGDRGS